MSWTDSWWLWPRRWVRPQPVEEKMMGKCRAKLRLANGGWAHCKLSGHPHWLGTDQLLHSDKSKWVEWTDSTPGATPSRPPSLWEQLDDQLRHAYSYLGHYNYIALIDTWKWDAFKFEKPMHGQFHFAGSDQHGRWMTVETDFGMVRCFEFRAAEGDEWIQVRSWEG